MNFVTAPGWVMSAAWAMYLLLILLFFKEPERPTLSSRPTSEKNLGGSDDEPSSTLNEPLLANLNNKLALALPKFQASDEEEGENDDSDYGDDRAVETFSELVKELTMPIKILLWIYFMLKFASELLISESSILTSYYFDWTTYQVPFHPECYFTFFHY